MKKLFVILSFACVLIACQQKTQDTCPALIEDGLYIVGPATAVENLKAENSALALMAPAMNAATKQYHAGLYEKYIALEGGKMFTMALRENQRVTNYGAQLELGEPYDAAYSVTTQVYRGALMHDIMMSVPASGLYHIVLDLNVNGNLPEACIVVAPVAWSINADPEWKMTPSDFNKTHMTWTLKDKEMKKGDKYKYAYGNGWKIKLTPSAEIVVETNLGEGMKSGASDIVISNSGKYDFELEWNLAGGAIEKSFKDNTACTEEYEDLDHVYMIGQFCGWSWDNAFDMPKVIDQDAFYAVKYLQANEGFKFNRIKEWESAFTALDNGVEGAEVVNDSLVVDADGIYTVYIDYNKGKVFVEPAQIYGVGPAFNDWGWEGVPQSIVGDKVILNVRETFEDFHAFAHGAAFGNMFNWWKHEFKLVNGQIIYRLNEEITPCPVTAGQTITLDFNAGTGIIQ